MVTDYSRWTQGNPDAMDILRQRRQDIMNKVSSGNTEEAYAIGGSVFTQTEWTKIMKRVDKELDATAEAQELRAKQRDEEAASLTPDGVVKGGALVERLTNPPRVPYGRLATDGRIEYNGVIFVCDERNNAICLGDMTETDKILTIKLEDGGSLKVNRDNIGDLKKALGMFSPADLNRILSALAFDNRKQQVELEIEEEKNGLGKSADDAMNTIATADCTNFITREQLKKLLADPDKEDVPML